MMTTKVTINGKSQEEIFAALRKDFSKEAIDHDFQGHVYVKMSAVEDRLYEVLGLNYSTYILQSKTETVMGVPYFLFDCKITIRDDNGNIVCERSASGGTQIRILAQGDRAGQPVDAAEDYKSAVQTAFKKAARTLGVAAYLTEENSNSSSKENRKNSGGAAAPATNPEKLSFKVLSKPNALSKCVKVDVVSTDGGERGELVLWNQVAGNIDPKVVDAFRVLNPGQTLCCEVTRGSYRNALQFSIQKFVQQRAS